MAYLRREDLKVEIGSLRTELRAELKEFRTEIKKEIHEIVEDALAKQTAQFAEIIHDLMGLMDKRFNRIEGILGAERGRLDDHGGRIVTIEKKVGLQTST